MKTDDKQKQLEDFVLSHYQHGRLDTQQALRNVRQRLQQKEEQPQQAHTISLWQRLRHVAAAVVLVLVMVSAYAIYRNAATPQPAPTEQVATPPQPAPAVSKTFHFDDTPINVVLSQLSQHYGVTLTAGDTTRHLSGDFEADDLEMLLSMIEQTLGIEIDSKKR